MGKDEKKYRYESVSPNIYRVVDENGVEVLGGIGTYAPVDTETWYTKDEIRGFVLLKDPYSHR